MNTSAQNRNGSAILIVIIIVVLGGIAAILLSQGKLTLTDSKPVETLPPLEQRTNPLPQTSSSLSMGQVNPGSSVMVEKVVLAQEGYVEIFVDVNGQIGKLLGKSKLLAAGEHDNVLINLASSVKDGDVVLVQLYTKTGAVIVDENNNPIQLQKNIGVAMGHYDQSEY